MIRTIITHPHATLRMSAKPFNDPSHSSAQELSVAHDLMETLESTFPLGAGLSAHQINIPLRMFVINLEITDGQFMKQYFINPTIIQKSTEIITDWEGCLSIPDQWGKVDRHKSVQCIAHNLNGEQFTVSASDFYARLIQHELDHLHGILFIDKLKSRLFTTDELNEMSQNDTEDTPHSG